MQQEFHHCQPLVKAQRPQLGRALNGSGEHALHICPLAAGREQPEKRSERRGRLIFLQELAEQRILNRKSSRS